MSIQVTFAGFNYDLPTTGDEDFWGLDLTNFLVALANNSASGISLGNFGSAPNAKGASLSGTTLTMQPADDTHPGMVSTGAQTFAGDKTIDGMLAATNLSGNNTGDFTITSFSTTPSAKGLNASAQALFMTAADGTHPGGVSTAAQTFAGAKTFSSSPVFSTATHVRATRATAQSMTNGTPTTIVFNTEVYDTRSEYDPATGIFTAAETGYYHISANAALTSTALTGGAALLLITINGTIVVEGSPNVVWAAQTAVLGAQVSATVALTAGDTVVVQMLQTSGGAVNLNAFAPSNCLSIDRLF